MNIKEIKKSMMVAEKTERVESLMKELIHETNTMGFEDAVAQGIVNGLLGSHRTLQQSFVRAFVNACKSIDEMPTTRITDGRNDAAIAIMKKISKLDDYIPYV